jgi:hypothetical protein
MKYIILLVVLFAIPSLASPEKQWKHVYVSTNGIVQSVENRGSGNPVEIDNANNDYSIDQWNSFGITNALPYIIKDGNVWRNMTQAEQEALNSSKKSDRQKALENKYLDLTKSMYTLANDPRKDVVPTPKCDDDETGTILESLFDVGGATEKNATKLAIKLQNLQVQLDKLDKDWWDTVSYHN